MTTRWNEELLARAGFAQIDCVWRWMNFAAWVARQHRDLADPPGPPAGLAMVVDSLVHERDRGAVPGRDRRTRVSRNMTLR